MLQPMQPTGQQQRPGTNMPQAPGQQTMPAGAAFQRGILPGGIASNPDDIKAAYGGTPQGQQKLQQSAQQGDYLSAIALAQILEEERERASAKAAQGGKPQPVVDRMRDEAVELRRQDLEEQQAKRLGMEQQRSQAAMAQMVQQGARPQMQGIAQLPAQNVAQPQAMAAGGIVAFDNGGEVVEKFTEEEVRPVGPNPYAGMSPRQMGLEYARSQLGTNRDEAERRKREEYMRFAGMSPEEKAAQQKRLAELEAYDREAYDPERLRREGLAAFLMGAANTGGIGETLARSGQSGLNYSNKMRELARQRMEVRHKAASDIEEAQRGVRAKAFDIGAGEGKELLGGQRQGIAALGDIMQADAARARMAQAGGGATNKATEDASQAVARDNYTVVLKKKQADYEPGSKEFNDLQAQIDARAKAIYASFPGAVYPTYPELPQAPEPEKKKGVFDFLSGMFGGGGKEQAPVSQEDMAMTGGAGVAAQSGLPAGIPPGSVKIGTSKGRPVYETPEGKRLVVTQ